LTPSNSESCPASGADAARRESEEKRKEHLSGLHT